MTYLVFPKSAEKPHKVPDYAHWKQRCEELLEDFGGLGENVSLFTWKDTLPKIEPEKKPDTESKEGGVKGDPKKVTDHLSEGDGVQKEALKTPEAPKVKGGKNSSDESSSKSPSMPLPAGVTAD